MSANPDGPPPPGKPKLLSRVQAAIRLRHYSLRTERAYSDWIKRFILFHGKRHPEEMGEAEITEFLTHLAVQGGVAASTQNQALSALLFLYREVLKVELPWVASFTPAKRPVRLPVVLTREEVQRLFAAMEGTMLVIAQLLYGGGLRLLEGLRLRVKDLDFGYRQIVVRDGKGAKDRLTILPDSVRSPLKRHLARVRLLHYEDLEAGFGQVWLPSALQHKYPQAPREWGWQWVFPAAKRSLDPHSGQVARQHASEKMVQRAVQAAAKKAGPREMHLIITIIAANSGRSTHDQNCSTMSAPS